MGKHKSDDYKLSAVRYYLQMDKPSIRKTCKIFDCNKESLRRWIIKYKMYGNVKYKSRKLGSYKVTKKHVKYILYLIKRYPNIFIKDLLIKFHKKFKNVKLSRSHLNRIIRDNNVTFKRLYRRHFPKYVFGKPLDYKQIMKKFMRKINKYSIKHIISLDETSISPGMFIEWGRCDLGKRCMKRTSNNIIFLL